MRKWLWIGIISLSIGGCRLAVIAYNQSLESSPSRLWSVQIEGGNRLTLRENAIHFISAEGGEVLEVKGKIISTKWLDSDHLEITLSKGTTVAREGFKGSYIKPVYKYQ